MKDAEGGETRQRFGVRLRELRAAKGVSASELAYRVGVTEGAIRSMESGATKSPSFGVGLKIAAVLGVDAWRLATGAETPLVMTDPIERDAVRTRFDDLERRLAALETTRGETARGKGDRPGKRGRKR
ncbi:MAG: helix-turn-helix domain-containing protein [Myxococcota bacterium]|nr:helix-turn-helix domain-containing protein [Myxococcota bacterium]